MGLFLQGTTPGGTDSASSFTLASWSPQANELVLIFVNQRTETITPTVAGNSLTWVQVATVDNEQGQNGMSLFRAMGASPTSGQITVTLTGNTLPANAIALRISGANTSGTNGSGAAEASGTDDGPAIDNDDALIAITTLTANAWVIAGFGHRQQTFTTPSGQTLVAALTNGTAGNTTQLTVVLKEVATPASTTMGGANSLSANGDWYAIAVSIKPAAEVDDGGDAVAVVRRQIQTYSNPLNISLAAFEPLAVGSAQVAELSGEITSYDQEITAFGGYWSARIRIDGRRVDLEEWYERGLDRRITAYSPDGVVIWEGFVNSVKLNFGGLQKTIGPVLDIANKVRLIFSYIPDGSQETGLRLSTDWASDTTSQGRYGILERILSSGGTTITNADKLRDQYLVERARPGRSEEFAVGGSATSLELDCAGYVHRLDTYTYNTTTTGSQNLSAKIAAVIDADPNDYLTSANAIIEANTLQVPIFENDNRLAMNVIKSLVAQGNAASDRCLFGVYAGRQAQYRAVVEQTDYLQAQSETRQQVRTGNGAKVEPWYVQSGKWLRTSDFLIGRISDTTTLRDDPRYAFLESVHFTAPYSLSWTGGRVSKLSQKLAGLGLAGIGG